MTALTIHHLLDSLAVGGAETLVATLARLHSDIGHNVVVHCLYGPGPLADPLRPRGIPVLLHSSRFRSLALLHLTRALRSHRPHVLHCHNIAPTVLGAPAARLAGVPCIIATRHGPSTHRPDRERKFWLASRLCCRVVAVSHAAHRDFLSDPWTLPHKLTVIPNGAAPPRIPTPPCEPARPAAFTLISVGRLTPEKDFPSLLHAFAILSASLPNVRLWILGDGPERESLRTLIQRLGLSDSVQMLGMRDDVGYWLAQADLFVLASVSEGLPVALLEALAVGLPAVVTNVGGMPEVLESSGAGIVVPPRDPPALAAAILEIARRPDRLPALREAARRRYSERYTLERMAADYLRLYLECLGRAPLPPPA